MNDLAIAPMSPVDLERVIDWAAQEGWNPGLHDASAFRAADPEGFLMAWHAGEPVASISAVRYGPDFGFIGQYIVQPAYRGRGFGWTTWQAGMAHLRGRTIGLDGVVAQQDNYRRSGFTLHHRNIRYEGRAVLESLPTCPTGTRIVHMNSISLAQVAAYDQAFFPAGRTAFLTAWFHQPGAGSLAILKHGILCGYGVIRPCRTGYKIGPLFADTEVDAERLLLSLCARIPMAEPVFLDIPECNPPAIRLAERHAMRPMFETARMYAGTPPDMALGRTFGITTFELG